MESAKRKGKKSILYKIGMGLLIISLSLWLVPVVTPFLPIATATKAGIIVGVIIVAEVLFWLGALLVGKEVASKIKSYFNPKNWRQSK
ncbi:transporter suffix domain-containing protein [Lysinibacillus piscis]|uniref:Transporter suffix domain-containing protein n=1 Tax=Lysinibacillus piscis TaxID=2518931 RepID=A0ABQ5NMR6_9BACI|nr:transporter suffix domain-containing protein [Lysinibacillus sp. KH24]GLC89597.1 hypothetical protein LYSBPC_27240 [Lysinibacillus sp. KH24]